MIIIHFEHFQGVILNVLKSWRDMFFIITALLPHLVLELNSQFQFEFVIGIHKKFHIIIVIVCIIIMKILSLLVDSIVITAL